EVSVFESVAVAFEGHQRNAKLQLTVVLAPSEPVPGQYEMLRAHLVDGHSVTEAAAEHGYSRAAFYLVLASFSEAGMSGLLDEGRGRRGPVKLRPEIVTFIRESAAGAGELVEQ